ncbi:MULTISPECIES: hypothetical protein [unclassified Myroides]|uniref:hypothetical protein n=1 Tax=unclassified Myroides TaxID=2642485 RepID=UPI003D2F9089
MNPKLLLLGFVLIALSACSQLSPSLVKSKYTADEVLRKLAFTQPYVVKDSTPVIFSEKKVSSTVNKEKFVDTPWEGATTGREFVIIEYTDPKQKTELGYLYQVYLWRDYYLPFFVNQGDGGGQHLKYNGSTQPYYRVNYSSDLHVFKYPILVEPNQVLHLMYLRREKVVSQKKVKIDTYEFRAEESRGVELIDKKEEPCNGSIRITYTIKVIADDAWIVVDHVKKVNTIDVKM